ncbi:MAG TPA: tetratricopeptide repeat protein, partial [Iamia sp.]
MPPPPEDVGLDKERELALLREAMVKIFGADGAVRGAGFQVQPDVVVTAAHVWTTGGQVATIGGAEVVVRQAWTFAERKAKKGFPPWPDLAILHVEPTAAIPLRLAESSHGVGEGLRVAGFPTTAGSHGLSILPTSIVALDGDEGEYERLMTVRLQGGFSGGPVIDPRLAAVVAVEVATKDPQQDHGGFAVSVEHLRARWPAALDAPALASADDQTTWREAYPRRVLSQAGQGPQITGEGAQRRVVFPLGANDPGFVERPALVEELTDAGQTGVIRALGGSGGVGKSELALWWAHQRRAAGDRVVWWIDATDAVTTNTGIAALADALGLPPAPTAEETAAALNGTLAGLEGRWLVVFDNADDLTHLTGLIPAAGNGTTLITTRSTAAADLDCVEVEVGEFTAEEAVAYLTATTEQADADAAERIAAALCRLPLALAQAAAYIDARGVTLAGYADLVEHDLDRAMTGKAARHQRTIDSLWDHILPHLDDTAVQLVARAAVTHPRNIPVELLATDADGLDDVRAAVLRAARYRLLTYTPGPTGPTAVAIHQLTQHAIAHGETAIDIEAATSAVIARLANLLATLDVELPSHWTQFELLDPHAIHLQPRLLATDEGLNVLAGLAIARRSSGRTADAIALQETIVEAREQGFGVDAMETLTARAELAVSYWSASRFDEAIPLEEDVLAAYERMSGDDDPATLTVRDNLAASYSSVGRLDEATALQEAVVAARERTFGDDDLTTLTAR